MYGQGFPSYMQLDFYLYSFQKYDAKTIFWSNLFGFQYMTLYVQGDQL